MRIVGIIGFACIVLGSAAVVGCVQPGHPPGAQEVTSQDCYTCHRSDYEATTAPVHPGNKPTTCWQCHSTSAWIPALEGGDHPEDKFPIASGAHSGIACTDCHDATLGSSQGGMNVSCIGCHTGQHAQAIMVDAHSDVAEFHWDSSRPAFCRDCHPRGRR